MENNDEMLEPELEPEDGEQWWDTGDRTGQDCAKELNKLEHWSRRMENNDVMLEPELEPEDGEWRVTGAGHPDVKHAARDLGLFAYVHSSSDFTYMKVLFL